MFVVAEKGWGRYERGTMHLCKSLLAKVSTAKKFKRLAAMVEKAKVEVKESRLGGRGYFATADISPGAFLSMADRGIFYPDSDGVSVSNSVAQPIHIDCKTVAKDGRFVVDGTLDFRSSLAYYINHKCGDAANATFVNYYIPVREEGLHQVAIIAVKALKRIKKGEEICVDYNYDMQTKRGGKKTVRCRCGNCKGKYLIYI